MDGLFVSGCVCWLVNFTPLFNSDHGYNMFNQRSWDHQSPPLDFIRGGLFPLISQLLGTSGTDLVQYSISVTTKTVSAFRWDLKPWPLCSNHWVNPGALINMNVNIIVSARIIVLFSSGSRNWHKGWGRGLCQRGRGWRFNYKSFYHVLAIILLKFGFKTQA